MLQAIIPTPQITLGSTKLPFGQTTIAVAGMSSISTSAATVGGEADANTLHLTPSANSTGVLLAGGSHTGSDATSDFSLSTTLNTSGGPDVFKIAVTHTASGGATKLFNIYAGVSGTTSVFSVSINGATILGANSGISNGASASVSTFDIGSIANAITIASSWPLAWGSGASTATPDTGLSRITAGIVGVGTGAQGSIAGGIQAATLALGGASIGSNALAVSGGMNVTNGNIILALTASTAILTNNDNAGLQFIFGGAAFGLGTTGNGVFQASLSTPSTATWHLGTVDAASPVAQTLGVQGVVAGTSNTAGALWTFRDSVGTGTGASGGYAFQVAAAGSTGTAQNTWANALTIDSTKLATFGASIQIPSGQSITEPNNQATIKLSSSFGLGNGIVFHTYNSSNYAMNFYYSNTVVSAVLNLGTNVVGFSASTTTSEVDVILSRISAGLIGVSTGAAGGTSGSLSMTNLTASGNINFTGLPTSDPHVVGRLWRNSGVLTVSAG